MFYNIYYNIKDNMKDKSNGADRVVRKWKKSNPQLWNKFGKIIHEPTT